MEKQTVLVEVERSKQTYSLSIPSALIQEGVELEFNEGDLSGQFLITRVKLVQGEYTTTNGVVYINPIVITLNPLGAGTIR